MSHITTVDLKVTSIPALKAAAVRLGLEFRENQKTFLWFGSKRSACDHAIGIAGSPHGWEIGCIAQADKSFALNFDPYSGGGGLNALIGKNANKLKQAYGAEVTIAEFRRKGWRHTETRNSKTGAIELEAVVS